MSANAWFAAAAFACAASAAAPDLRVALIGANGQPAAETQASLAGLSDFLSQAGAVKPAVTSLPRSGPGGGLASALQAADVAVLWVRGRTLEEPGRAALLDFLSAGKGIVVLEADGGTWTDWPGFEPEVLGARFGDAFANGAPMRVINLFPHPIFTGVERFDTRQPMRKCELAADTQIVMEGTVGEDTVPMSWARRFGGGRVLVLQPGGRALLGDPDYRRIVLNGVRWAGRRPIPGAKTLIQRTMMPDSYPGALAISLPGGPSICYDTVRGGINFIWDGDFTDLHPWWTTRHGAPLREFDAKTFGRMLYKDATLAPAMHVGTRNAESAYHFRGYRIKGDGYPELFYTVGGRHMSEDLAASVDGVGVTCTFHVDSGEAPLWVRIDPDAGAAISVAGAILEGNMLRFDTTSAGEFTVTIRARTGAAR